MEPLTTAELRALHALARYETATQAAEAAGLQPQTLRNQAHHAFQKLGVNGRLEAFRKIGWLRPPRFMPSADDPDPLRSGFEEALDASLQIDEDDLYERIKANPNVRTMSLLRGTQEKVP